MHRERRVVALVGDGGMGMTMAEVETAVREGAHVVAIVFDNERYGMIRAHQDRNGSPTAPGTDLGPVDFAAAARACGARGVRVESDAAFEGVLRTALAASGPTVIQVALDRRWVSVDAPATGDGGVTRPTLHLVPEAVWEAHDPALPYLPAAYAQDGFVHCTDGDEEMVDGRQPLLPRRPASVPPAHAGPGADGEPVAVRRPERDLPPRVRVDRPGVRAGGPPDAAGDGRDVHRDRPALGRSRLAGAQTPPGSAGPQDPRTPLTAPLRSGNQIGEGDPMLLLARWVSALLGIASIVLSIQIMLERRQYDQPFDLIVITGAALGLLFLAAAAFVRSPASIPRLLAWAGIGALVVAGAWLPFIAVTSARDALVLALIPLVLALALAAVLARGRLAADRIT